MRESAIERKAVEYAAMKYGIPAPKLSGISVAGYPDRLFLIPGGKPLFIEFKKLGGIVSPLQEMRLARLLELGYIVAVCYSYDEARQEIDYAVSRAQEEARVVKDATH